MRKKKVIALLMMGVLSVALVACSEETDKGNVEETKKEISSEVKDEPEKEKETNVNDGIIGEEPKVDNNITEESNADENIEKIYEKSKIYTIDGEDFAMVLDIKKDKETDKEIGTLSVAGTCNTKEKAILMETTLMVFCEEFQKMDSDTIEFNHLIVISVKDDNKTTIMNSNIGGFSVLGGTNNDGSTASGKMPDWFDDTSISKALISDGSMEYMDTIKEVVNQFFNDVQSEFN